MEEYANSTPSLPTEMLIQIFSHLPVKSLKRFCCVCKSWKNLITSDRTLIRYHLKQSQDRNTRSLSNVLMYSAYNDMPTRELPDLVVQKFINAGENCCRQAFFLGHDFYLVGCINGVFCFYKYWDSNLYLWNPALRQCQTLPPCVFHFAFSRVTGFVYESINDEYKVVKIFQSSYALEVEIYKLSSNSWKTSICHCHPSGDVDLVNHSVAVVHNGALHWISSCYKDGASTLFLNVFDLSGETFQETMLSDHVPIEPDTYYTILGLFEGCLCLSGRSRTKEYEVWVMKEYGLENSWTKQFLFPSLMYPLRHRFGLTRNGKFLAKWVVNGSRFVILYDSETEGIEFVQNEEILLDFNMDYFFTDNYVESLVSVIPLENNSSGAA